MAITNAQQFKQLVNPPMEGKKRPGYRGEAAAASDRAAGRNAGRDTSPAGTGNVGGDFDRASFQAAVIEGQLRDLAKRQAEEKIEEKLEPFRNLGSNTRKFQNFAKRYLPSTAFLSKFGPLNLRDFYTEKFLDSKNAPYTKEEFAMLPEEKKEELFNKYEKARGLGEIDAYGNSIGDTGGDGLPILLPQMTAQAPSITEEKEEEPFTPNLRLLAGGGMADETVGGIMDLESARQMYGLGKLVKKVTRGVKKIAKSPIGKAVLAFGAYKLGGMDFGKGGSLFERFGNLGPLQKALFGIGATSVAAGLMTKEEEEKPLYAGADIDDPRYIMNNPGLFTNRRLAAEGGDIEKEPVAKKVMP